MKSNKKYLMVCLVVALVVLYGQGLYAEDSALININTATNEELCKLKGVGTKIADRIIKYREEKGPFEKPEDIQNVKGIGQKTWEANKDQICVE